MFSTIGKLACIAILLGSPGAGCANEGTDAVRPGSNTVTVFAAASLVDAFTEIARQFEAENPESRVRLNLAGSQRLRTQLELGAQADVFASADEAQMKLAVAAGLVDSGPVVFASNEMAAIAALSGSIAIDRLEQFSSPGVKVGMAHQAVPAGAYSRALLVSLSSSPAYGDDFSSRVLDNVVSEEPSVRGVEQKVVLGEVDAGFVYRTGALTAVETGDVRAIFVPPEHNVQAEYPIAVLNGASDTGMAQRFVDFVLARTGQATLAAHGFGPP